MGGRGSGGTRVGAGRKPKSQEEKWLGGDAGKRGDGKRKPQAPPPVTLIAAPADLPEAQAVVWNTLAPHACAQRTLTAQTAAAFALLCKQIVLEQLMFQEITTDGLTGTKVTLQMDEKGGGLQSVEKKAHTLLAQHRQMMQRVEAGMLRFRLSPIGKEMTPAEQPKDEWDEFETPTVQ